MAWLQKRPQVANPTNFYTVGLNKTLLIVGLGNLGAEYDLTRHNAGFMCLDNFVAKNSDVMSGWVDKKDLKCHFSSGQFGDTRVLAIKPTTFMNLSGQAVQAAVHFYKISPEHILVVHDELDVDFGQIRLRVGGSDAGHNGIKSIISVLGEDFGRVRVGIGPKTPARIKSEDFVLKKFSAEQQAQLPNMLQEVSAVLSEYAYAGSLLNETRNFLI